jgi:hypothetical protein
MRYGIAGVVVLVGLGLMIFGNSDVELQGGAGIVGAGLAILLMNVLFRVGLYNDRDRDQEEEARAFYERHGRWPDETA